MVNLWRATDAAEGCGDRPSSGCQWLPLNLTWAVMPGAACYHGHASRVLSRSGASVGGAVVALKESAATENRAV